MTAQRKRLQALMFSGVAIAAVVVLAAGLSEVRLQPGQPFPFSGFAQQQAGGSGLQFGGEILLFVLRVFLLVVWLLMPFAIIYLIISPKARRRLLRDLITLLPLFVLLHLLLRHSAGLVNLQEAQPAEPQAPSVEMPALPAFEPMTTAPGWFVFAVSLGLALLIVVPLVLVFWFLWRRGRRRASGLERLAQEAQEALDAIQAGADLRDAVVRCYVEMARVVREQRGIRRDSAETVREFADYLEEVGLPGEDVQRLTRLFEGVRYGAKPAGENEEHQAVAALSAIAQACRGVP